VIGLPEVTGQAPTNVPLILYKFIFFSIIIQKFMLILLLPGCAGLHIVTGFAIWSSNPANLTNPFPLGLSEACQGVHNPASDPIIP
jgi:hypothetical protein